MNYYLGIDCGGTFIKAALFDTTGKLQGMARQNVSVISEQSGYAERDPKTLWQITAQVVKTVIEQSSVDAQQIKGVGISAQGKSAFFLDEHQRPLGRAILSSDQRSLEIVKNWQACQIPEKLYPLTRQTLWTGHPVSILRWLKEHERERYDRIGSILMSHDYLRFCLTGQLFCEETNISESNLYNMETGQYDIELAKLLGIEEVFDKLPPIIKPNEIAGYVTPQAAEITGLAAGTPVVGGLFDVVSTALCAGLDDEEKLNVVLGTWSVVSGITDHIDNRQSIPFVYGRYVEKNQFIVHEASPTSSGNLEWFLNRFKPLDYQTLNTEIEALPPASSTVLFVPFLYGSNAKLGMQAGFYGLQAHHTEIHLLQAVYEGVLFSLMHHLKRMTQRFPHATKLRVTGGPTQSKVWMQMLADLTGMQLEIPLVEETGCFGAALVAIEAIEGIDKKRLLNSTMNTFTPNKANFNAYQEKYQRYLKFVQALETLV
ncbi:carbohydrate kinase [Rodentibacter trehalosifermentans]|uniref:Carbohydrate kinase n=1 Tax=Rodentibacter trehalosifermentans TaxID=1908263 RepID=A0A1V3IS39_9PAST|nr:FGGY-family carbohydrate kinase [Rodentibacter trehalosifermentans]OOF44709.1 carbohydrate kinase [Rodentibacter trehalosifermentans]OOF49510.1 carbohydrate kinase [Rodentibacter trehalosifermentans]